MKKIKKMNILAKKRDNLVNIFLLYNYRKLTLRAQKQQITDIIPELVSRSMRLEGYYISKEQVHKLMK